MIRKITGL